jgi:hypothetical protein
MVNEKVEGACLVVTIALSVVWFKLVLLIVDLVEGRDLHRAKQICSVGEDE